MDDVGHDSFLVFDGVVLLFRNMDFFLRNLEQAHTQAKAAALNAQKSAQSLAQQVQEHGKVLAEQVTENTKLLAEQVGTPLILWITQMLSW